MLQGSNRLARVGSSRQKQIFYSRAVTVRFASLSIRAESTSASSPSPYRRLPDGWEAVIGVEVHAQLKSQRKLFSTAWTSSPHGEGATENSLVAPFDAALPGTLPRLEKESVYLALRACIALDCSIGDVVTFDRKHYFYPDLPNGFQITQKYAPLAQGGRLRVLYDDGNLSEEEEEVDVRIEQIQLEQDTAKTSHHDSQSLGPVTLLDLNRCGTALIEIVSGPDLRTPNQVGAYVRKLRDTLRRVGASDGNMEEGSLRCDVNVSVHRIGEPWGVRCEVKNLNSIRFVTNAVAHEMHRQQQAIERGEKIIQETRGYNEEDGSTYGIRLKEDAPDYRYMPDQNLPPLHIDKAMVHAVTSTMPELSEVQRVRLMEQYNVGLRDVNVLMRIGLGDEGRANNADPVTYFETVAQGRNGQDVINWINHTLLNILNTNNKTFDQNPIRAQEFGQLIDLVRAGSVTNAIAKSLLAELVADEHQTTLQPFRESTPDNAVQALLSSRNVLAIGGGRELEDMCKEVIASLPQEAELVRKGKDKVVMRLVGEVMKRSKGRANAQAARHVLLEFIKG